MFRTLSSPVLSMSMVGNSTALLGAQTTAQPVSHWKFSFLLAVGISLGATSDFYLFSSCCASQGEAWCYPFYNSPEKLDAVIRSCCSQSHFLFFSLYTTCSSMSVLSFMRLLLAHSSSLSRPLWMAAAVCNMSTDLHSLMLRSVTYLLRVHSTTPSKSMMNLRNGAYPSIDP